jgi:charged multivesicular body protein 2A
MAFLFGGGRQSGKETIKDYQRKISGNARSLEREVSRMDLREGVMQKELAKYAKDGKMEAATAKAKEIVRLRAHKERVRSAKGQMTGLAQQLQTIHSTGQIQEAMAETTQMLHTLNSRMDIGNVSRMLVEFEKQSVQMQNRQELMNDTLDAGFEADGEQEDCNEAVIGVLEEVGLDMRARLSGRQGDNTGLGADMDETELISRLERLKPPAH